MRIVLAEPGALVRAGLRALLETEEKIEVIGEAEALAEAVSMSQQLRPDVVLLDVGMGEGRGVEAISRLLEQCPRVRVIALASRRHGHRFPAALESGARACLLKHQSGGELIEVLFRVAAGERGLGAARGVGEGEERVDRPHLSERELEVLRRFAAGSRSKEVADELGISTKTVDAHRLRGMDKLGLANLAQLTRYALCVGLIRLDEAPGDSRAEEA